MLELKNVTGTDKKFKLDNISFTAPTGFITGLTGINGAGKTTLLHYIIDKKQQYTGEILYNGQNIRQDFADFKNNMAYISDEKRFFQDYTIVENAALLSGFFHSWDNDYFHKSLKEFDISCHKRLYNLSRGEYIKFQLAFSLAHNATLFLLDETTAGMDPVFRRDFFQLMHELIAREDITILMTTHIEEELNTHMDYVGTLDNGRLVSFGEVEAI